MKDLLIVIPYRNREEHLKALLENSPEFFNKTNLTYDFLICELEQIGDWNAGLCVNSLIDFVKTGREYKWLYIHHVDIWPVKGEWKFPEEKEVFFNMGDYGSCLMKFNDFLSADGYCNSFWGWGGEDNELYQKFKENGLKVTNYTEKNYVEYNTGFQNHPRKFNGKNYANAIKQSMLIPRHERNNIKHFYEHAYTKDLTNIKDNIYKHTVCPIQKSPSDTINKNLIITYLKNENDFNKLVSFTKSSQLHASYSYDVVAILTDKIPNEWMVNQLQTFGIECQFYNSYNENPYIDRFFCYKQYLEFNKNYNFIMHADIFDLHFQLNPFSFLEKNVITFTKDDNKLSTGVIGAPRDLFLQLCDFITKNYKNYDINEKRLDKTLIEIFINTCDKITLKTEQDQFCANLKNNNNINIYGNRRVYNKQGQLYAVVHQTHIYPELKNTVDNHFLRFYFPL